MSLLLNLKTIFSCQIELQLAFVNAHKKSLLEFALINIGLLRNSTYSVLLHFLDVQISPTRVFRSTALLMVTNLSINGKHV
jgi:hypothetical protein